MHNFEYDKDLCDIKGEPQDIINAIFDDIMSTDQNGRNRWFPTIKIRFDGDAKLVNLVFNENGHYYNRYELDSDCIIVYDMRIPDILEVSAVGYPLSNSQINRLYSIAEDMKKLTIAEMSFGLLEYREERHDPWLNTFSIHVT